MKIVNVELCNPFKRNVPNDKWFSLKPFTFFKMYFGACVLESLTLTVEKLFKSTEPYSHSVLELQ